MNSTTRRAIAKAICARNRESGRKEGIIRTSSIGYCSRKIGYDILGYEGEPESAHGLFTLELGTAIHYVVQKQIARIGWVDAELTVENGELVWKNLNPQESGFEIEFFDEKLRLSGHCDGITKPLKLVDGNLVPSPDGEQYLIEIKSITSKSNLFIKAIMDGGTGPANEKDAVILNITPSRSSRSNRLQQLVYNFSHARPVKGNRGVRTCPVYEVLVDGKRQKVTILLISNILGKFEDLTGPLPEHVAQASVYASYFGLDKVMFIYVGKDVNPTSYELLEESGETLDVPWKVFIHEVDKNIINAVRYKVTSIYSYTDEKKLPPREYEKDSVQCAYCKYRKLCWEEG